MTSISLPPTLMPPRGYLAVIRTIDKFTEWTGYLFVLFIIPLIFANVIEVFARYVLKDPTIWALDVTTMSYAALFMLGSALALLKGAHVRTDMLWEAFSDRTKGMIDSLAFMLFFLPTMVVLFFISIDDFLYSISIDERSSFRSMDADPVAAARRHSAYRLHAVPAGHLRAHEEPLGLADRRVPDQAREDRGLSAMSYAESLGLIMLVGMVAVIFIGFPISFTLLFLAIIFGGLGLGWEQTFNLAYLQIWGTMKDEIFPAVPLFIFMGYMTEQAGPHGAAVRGAAQPAGAGARLALSGGHPHRDDLRHGDRHRRRRRDGARHHGRTDDDQDRLRRAAVGGRHRRRRHARHSDSAQRDAGGDGPDHGRTRQPALFGGVRPRLPARGLLHRLHADPQLHQSEARPAHDDG